MTILKHGKYFNKPVSFKCDCGCEFVAERNEYSICHRYIYEPDDDSTIKVSYARMTCPECGEFTKTEISE